MLLFKERKFNLKYNRTKATRTISNAISSNSFMVYENMNLPYNYWTYYYEKLQILKPILK
eukprot:Pgem_evm1s19416